MVFVDTEHKKIHSIVVGMGPAGLTSALNLLLSGHNVTLIDKRSDYTLKQKVRISDELFQLFSLYNIDDTFLKKLTRKNFVCSLRKFQAYQLSVLKEIYEKQKITSKKGASKEILGSLVILQGEDAEITTIDGDSQSVSLRDGAVLSFDNLIDATGSKRYITTLLQAQSNGKYHIDYVSDLPQHDHQENAIIYFNAPVKKNLFKTPKNASNNYYLSDFTDREWKKDRAPIYYIASNAVKQKIYLMIEIPAELLNEQDHHKIIDFAKPVLMQECKIDAETFNVQASDLKIYSTFTLKHEITDKPYTMLGRGGVCLVVGDAFSPANFHFGHGILKAIQDGNNLTKVFKDNQFHPDQLELRAREVREEFRLHTSELTALNLKKKAALKVPEIFSEPESLTEYDKNSNNDAEYYDTYQINYFNHYLAEPLEKRKHEDQNHQDGPKHKKNKH